MGKKKRYRPKTILERTKLRRMKGFAGAYGSCDWFDKYFYSPRQAAFFVLPRMMESKTRSIAGNWSRMNGVELRESKLNKGELS